MHGKEKANIPSWISRTSSSIIRSSNYSLARSSRPKKSSRSPEPAAPATALVADCPSETDTISFTQWIGRHEIWSQRLASEHIARRRVNHSRLLEETYCTSLDKQLQILYYFILETKNVLTFTRCISISNHAYHKVIWNHICDLNFRRYISISGHA